MGLVSRLLCWLFGVDGEIRKEVEPSKVEIIEVKFGAIPVWLDLGKDDEIQFTESKNDEKYD